MCRKVFGAILLVLICFNSNAQTKHKITFDDGTVKMFTMIYDDPYELPKLTVGLGLMNLSGTNLAYTTFGPTMEYRFTSKFMVDMTSFISYRAHSLDNERIVDRSEEDFNRFADLTINTHYHLLARTKMKDKKVAIDMEGSSGVSTVYVAKFPRVKGRFLDLDLGYNLMSLPVMEEIHSYQTEGNTDDITYHLVNGITHNFNIGLSYNSAESYKMDTDGKVRRVMVSRRLYYYRVIGLAHSYDVITDDESTSDYRSKELDAVPDGLIEFNKMGWRSGYQTTAYFTNANLALTITFEIGKIPSIEQLNFIGESGGENNYLLHFGFCLRYAIGG